APDRLLALEPWKQVPVRPPVNSREDPYFVLLFLWLRSASLLDKQPSGGGVAGSGAPHQITIGIGDLGKQVLQYLLSLGHVGWGGRWDHFLLDEEALSGISGSLSLDHVIGTTRNSPSVLQILKLVSGLEGGCAGLVELLDHPARLIEVFVHDTFRATPEFLT